jgi:hypothetical protein
MELYDAQNRLAYGSNSYTFAYNKRFMPLKSKIFVDPTGAVVSDIPLTVISGGGGGGGGGGGDGGTIIDIVLDGGDAEST